MSDTMDESNSNRSLLLDLRNTPPQLVDCFGELWPQFSSCLDRSHQFKLKPLANTLLQAGSLEEQYAQNLALFRKKQSFDESNRTTVNSCLTTFNCMFLDNMIKSRIVVAHEYKTLGNKLTQFRQNQKKVRKRMVSESHRLDKQLSAQHYIFNRSKTKYLHACKNAEKAIDARDRAISSAANIGDYGKLDGKVKEAMTQYEEAENLNIQVVEETVRVQQRYETGKRKLVLELQKLEESRFEKAKATFERIAQIHKEQAEYMTSLVNELSNSVKTMSLENDLQLFVTELGATAPDAKDLDMRELVTFEKYTSPKLSKELGLNTAIPCDGQQQQRQQQSQQQSNHHHQQQQQHQRIPTNLELESKRSSTPATAVGLQSIRNLKLKHEPAIVGKIPPPPPPPLTPSEIKPGDFVKAQYSFKPTQPGMIELKRGQIIKVIEVCSHGWWTGHNESTGEDGIFPHNFITFAERRGPLTA